MCVVPLCQMKLVVGNRWQTLLPRESVPLHCPLVLLPVGAGCAYGHKLRPLHGIFI